MCYDVVETCGSSRVGVRSGMLWMKMLKIRVRLPSLFLWDFSVDGYVGEQLKRRSIPPAIQTPGI
eukprot:2006793-Amphidinium_carterae.1